jgi:glycosyltransferase involved in cell wall biosynthesis
LAQDELERLASDGSARTSQVLFLGTGRDDLNRDKGLEDLFEVLPDLWRAHPQSRWVLAGLADPNATFATLLGKGISVQGSDSRVRCLGVLDSRMKEDLLLGSTILALPSYFENMPNVLLEAMASGLGVVATKVGAIPEMLGEQGGILCRPGDRFALSQALGKLLSSPELAASQGKRNLETVSACYTMEVVEGALETLYREILGIPLEKPNATLLEGVGAPSGSVLRPNLPPQDRTVARS